MTNITLLDGGMGQELIRRGGEKATPLWSTQLLIDKPGLVAEVHNVYADAGSTVATTNTYAIHRDRLQGGDSNHYAAEGVVLDNMEHRFAELIGMALTEADVVRDRSRVAGSIGPLGASYRADLHPEEAAATGLYAEVAGLLAPAVDVLLFEAVVSITAAKSCLAGGRQTDKPVWISFTLDDEDGTKLRSGEDLSEAVAAVADADALLANCSAPEAMASAMPVLAAAGKPFGAYANGFQILTKAFIEGGTTADNLSPRRDLTPEVYADYALQWVEAGATIVGGCCEVGPAHIKMLHDRLVAAGHSIV